jgi:transcriptional regulator with XRE-family HTH domain
VINSADDFAQLIAHLRQQRGLSQGQLAQATRLSRTYIYHLENGMRRNPSVHVVHTIARALELQESERRHLYRAFTQLTGQQIDDSPVDNTLLDFGDLSRLLVLNTSYPAHSLDRLWYFHSWNDAVITLFEIQDELVPGQSKHLLELLFSTSRRRRLHDWEHLARRLVSDFQYNTHTLTHLPEYKQLWKRLRELPDFRRIASATYSEGRPEPSFVFHLQHTQLGLLALRTATTIFTGTANYSMVSYVPGNQRTLEVYRQYRWQPD